MTVAQFTVTSLGQSTSTEQLHEKASSSMPNLVPVFEYNAFLEADEVGAGPFGHRIIYNVTGGKFHGEGLSGSLVGAGADWLLVGADGFGRLDVRATFKTDDGAVLYAQYSGLIQVTEEIQAILGGADDSTEFGAQYFFTNPRIETGDERYDWVNRTMFIGQGRVVAGPAVEYKVFRLEN